MFDAAVILLQRQQYHNGGSWAEQDELWYKQLMIIVRLISYEAAQIKPQKDSGDDEWVYEDNEPAEPAVQPSEITPLSRFAN